MVGGFMHVFMYCEAIPSVHTMHMSSLSVAYVQTNVSVIEKC